MAKKILIVLASLLLALLVCGYFAVPYMFYSQIAEPGIERNDLAIRKHIDAWKREFANVSTLVDWQSGNTHDAGEFMNSRILWYKSPELCQPACELQLPEALIERMKNDAWLGFISSADFTGFDSSWFAKLKKYDHWDLFGSTQAAVKENGLFDHKTPDYRQLLAWAKIRMAAGVSTGKLREASSDVRHLARLIHSQNTVVSAMVAVNILKVESVLATRLRETQNPLSASLTALPLETIETLRRVCWASGFLFQPTTPADVLNELYLTDEYQLCRCAGVTEGLVMNSAIPESLRKHYLPERQKIFKTVTQKQTEACRLKPILNAPQNQYIGGAEAMAKVASFLGPLWARAFAGTIYGLGSPSAFHGYEEKPAK